MKSVHKLIIQSILFLLPAIIFVAIWTAWQLHGDRYKRTIPGNEIYRAIEKSKKHTSYKKLILGDSAGNQIYNCKKEDPDSAYSLACNQGISMVGHFILLNNFLEAGNRPDTVFMLVHPVTFSNNLNQVYTYHYFLKPFYTEEYIPLMSSTVLNQIHKIPRYNLSQNPLIKTTTRAWNPPATKGEKKYSFLSPIAKEYLGKIDSLSKVHHFDIEIIPTLLSEQKRQGMKTINKNEYADCPLKDKIDQYLNSIVYIDNKEFEDGIHLKHPAHYRERFNKILHVTTR